MADDEIKLLPGGLQRRFEATRRDRARARMARAGFEFGRRLELRGAPAGSVVEPARESPLRSRFEAHREGPGIWKWRHYFEAYERHLARFVGRLPTIVEIGVYSGGSLLMWQEYFGAGCRIVGVDIKEECRAYQAPGIDVVIGDQSDPAFWARFVERFPELDVIIDDGGHLAEQQIVTLEGLLPRLRGGGVYICEDVTGIANEFQAYVDGFADNLNEAEFVSKSTVRTSRAQALIHSVHHYPFLTVIERNAEPVGELSAPKHGTEWQPFL